MGPEDLVMMGLGVPCLVSLDLRERRPATYDGPPGITSVTFILTPDGTAVRVNAIVASYSLGLVR